MAIIIIIAVMLLHVSYQFLLSFLFLILRKCTLASNDSSIRAVDRPPRCNGTETTLVTSDWMQYQKFICSFYGIGSRFEFASISRFHLGISQRHQHIHSRQSNPDGRKRSRLWWWQHWCHRLAVSSLNRWKMWTMLTCVRHPHVSK